MHKILKSIVVLLISLPFSSRDCTSSESPNATLEEKYTIDLALVIKNCQNLEQCDKIEGCLPVLLTGKSPKECAEYQEILEKKRFQIQKELDPSKIKRAESVDGSPRPPIVHKDQEIQNLKQEIQTLIEESNEFMTESGNVQTQFQECSEDSNYTDKSLLTKKSQCSNMIFVMNNAHENTKSDKHTQSESFYSIDDCAEYNDQWKNSINYEQLALSKPINNKNINNCFQKVAQAIKTDGHDGAKSVLDEKAKLEQDYEDLEHKHEWTEKLLIAVSITQVILIMVFIVWGWKNCKRRMKEKKIKKDKDDKKKNSIDEKFRRLNSITDSSDILPNNQSKIPNSLPVLNPVDSYDSGVTEVTIYDGAPQPLTYKQHLAKRSLSKSTNVPVIALNVKNYDKNLRNSNEFMKFQTLTKVKKVVTFQSQIEFI